MIYLYLHVQIVPEHALPLRKNNSNRPFIHFRLVISTGPLFISGYNLGLFVIFDGLRSRREASVEARNMRGIE